MGLEFLKKIEQIVDRYSQTIALFFHFKKVCQVWITTEIGFLLPKQCQICFLLFVLPILLIF